MSTLSTARLDLGLPTSDREEQARSAALPAEPSLIGGLGAAISTQWSGAWAARQIGRSGYDEDPNFALTRENEAVLTAGLPEPFWDFSEAVSMDHAMAIRNQRLGQVKNLDTLGRMGWAGTALSIGAAMFDPVDMAVGAGVTALTGGTGLAPWLSGKAGRLRRLVASGIVGAAGAVPVQAYISSQDETQDGWDVLYAAAGGAIGGAGLDFLGQKWGAAWSGVRRNIEAADTLRYAMGAAGTGEAESLMASIVSRKGRFYFRGSVADADRAGIAAGIFNRLGLNELEDADLMADLSKLVESDPDAFLSRLTVDPADGLTIAPASGASVREVVEEAAPAADGTPGTPKVTQVPMQARDYHLTDLPEDSKPFAGGARFSYIGRLGSSDSPLVRRWSLAALGDPIARGGKAVGGGALEWAERESLGRAARFARAFDDAFSGHARDANLPRSARTQRAFAEAVAAAVRDPNPRGLAPGVEKAAAAVRTALADALEMAKRHGVAGLEDTAQNAQYLPRLWSAQSINQAMAIHGREGVADLLASAFARAHPDVSDELAQKVGRGMLDTLVTAGNRTDFDRARGISGLDPDRTREILREAGVTDPEQVEDILYGVNRLKPAPEDAGKISRARARVLLDEQAFVSTKAGRLAIADLLDNDAYSLTTRYLHQITGASASARLYDSVGRATGRTIRTMDDLKRALQDDMRAAGVGTENRVFQQSIDKTLALAEQVDKRLRGVPLIRDEGWNRLARRVRQYQHLRLSGSFGWAQIPEMTQVVAETGLSAAIRGMPSLGSFLGDFRRGAISNETLAEIEQVFGLGMDHYLHRAGHGGDDLDSLSGASRAGGVFDRVASASNRASNLASLTAPITRFSQLWAAGAAMQKWAAIGRSGKMPSATRLASMGIDEAQATRIIGALQAEARAGGGLSIVDGPITGRKVARFNFDQWKDQEAASLLIHSISRWSRRTIQTSDFASLAPWMANSAIGRTLAQFRTFAAVAYEKQLLHSVASFDANAAMRILLGTIAGGTVWAAREYVTSLGRTDRDEYLEQRITPRNFALAGVSRSGWASLLPGVVESMASTLGNDDRLFDFRTSGLAPSLLSADAVPSSEFINSAQKAANAAFGPLWNSDDQFTQADARMIFNLLPYKQLTGARSLFDVMSRGLPEK